MTVKEDRRRLPVHSERHLAANVERVDKGNVDVAGGKEGFMR